VTNPLDIAKTRLQTQDAYLAEQDVAGSRQHAARLERAAALRAARRISFFTSIRSLRERQAAAQAQRLAEAAAAPRFGGAAASAAASPATPPSGFVGHAEAQGQRAARETLRALASPPGGLKDLLLAKASLDLSTARAAAAGERALASALSAARGDGAGGAPPSHPLAGSLVARRRPRLAPAPAPPPPPPPLAPQPLPARARRVLAPLISMTPYQSSFSSNRALVDEALDAVRGALRAVDAARVGRLRRAPDAAALAPGGARRVMAPPPGAAGAAGAAGGLRRRPPAPAPAPALTAALAAAPAAPATRVLHRNLWATLRHIWVHEGPSALARGVFPRMMLHGPASAATFVCYEQVLRLSRKEGRGEESHL